MKKKLKLGREIVDQLKLFTEDLRSYKKEYADVIITISEKLPYIESQIDNNLLSVNRLSGFIDPSRSNDSGNMTQELSQFNNNLNSVISILTESKNMDAKIFEDLKETIKILNASVSKIREVDHISENLKVFAINSIVYSGQAGERGKGYQFISGEFIKLSEELAKKSCSINFAGENLNGQIKDFLQQINDHDEYNHKQIENLNLKSQELISNSNKSMHKLIENLELCIEPILNIKEPTNLIMHTLQKQDIIQQQIEHIHSTLIDLVDLLELDSNEELNDIYTVMNFLLVVTEKQLLRINDDLIEMLNQMEEPLNRISSILQKNPSISKIETTRKDRNKNCSNALDLIEEIFSSPVGIIHNITEKLDNSSVQKQSIITKFREIETIMTNENSIAGKIVPIMDMIKNLLFLATVEQKRNQLNIVLDLDNKKSLFSNHVFSQMDDIIQGIARSQSLISDNLAEVMELFNNQNIKYRDIKENLTSSLQFLLTTKDLFTESYNENILITMSLTKEISEYKELFAKLRFLHNNMSMNIKVCTDLKLLIQNNSVEFGGLTNINSCKFRDTIIESVLQNLTVNEERETILNEFPELEIEKTTGASVTLF